MIGHTVLRYEEVSSTNDRAKELLERPDADGLAVLALRQTKGRGRLGRSWFSPDDKGLYLSIIIKRSFSGNTPMLLCPAASLAAALAVEKMSGPDVYIKWPNDLIVNGKKAGGILIEQIGGAYIAGIGINLNTDPSGFPEDIKGKATSLMAESGTIWDRNVFTREYFALFEQLLSKISGGAGGDVLEKIKARSFTIGKIVDVRDGCRSFHGEAVGFEGDGSLLLKAPDGKILNIRSGEIK